METETVGGGWIFGSLSGMILPLILIVLYECCKKKGKFTRKEIRGMRWGLIAWAILPLFNLLHFLLYSAYGGLLWILPVLYILPGLLFFIYMLIQMHKLKNTVEKSERRGLNIVLVCTYFFGILNQLSPFYSGFFVAMYYLSLLSVILERAGYISFFLIMYKNRKATGVCDTEENEKMERLREKYPNTMRAFSQYHNFPVLSMLANLGALLLFLLPMIFGDGTMGWILAGFVLGSIALALIQIFLPLNKREKIAKEMMETFKNPEDTETNPYFYLYRREAELIGESIQPKSEKVFLVIAKILFVINYIFYILAAVLILVLTGIVAVAIGGTCWLMYQICKISGRGNSFALLFLKISKLAVEPLKWAFKLAKSVFTFQLLRAIKTDKSAKTVNKNNAKTPSASTMTASEAELCIDSYMHVNYILPSGARWGSESLECRGSSVSFSGVIEADAAYFDEYRLKLLTETAASDIKQTLEGQVNDFLRDYPMARRASVSVNIDGKLN